MLNRRQLRIKALQALYAHFQADDSDLVNTERFLNQNVDKLYDLYIYLLSLLSEIVYFAETRLEDSKNKYLPTEEDLHPNTRFIDNMFIQKLRMNKDFKAREEALKINWIDVQDSVRKLYKELITSDFYLEYMNAATTDFAKDKDILLKISNNFLLFNDSIISHLEDKYFLWSEDYYMALALVYNTLAEIDESWSPSDKLPPLFKNTFDDKGNNDDKKFLIDLVRKTIVNKKKYDEIISRKVKNWDFERIAAIDIVLIRMGMAEIYEFETIPLKVTLNEIIELAKHFSSPKSNVFINGLLDKTIEEGLLDKTIEKKGRGLIGQ